MAFMLLVEIRFAERIGRDPGIPDGGEAGLNPDAVVFFNHEPIELAFGFFDAWDRPSNIRGSAGR